MRDNLPITDSYSPDKRLRACLIDFQRNTDVENTQHQTRRLHRNLPAYIAWHTLTYEGYQIQGMTTTSQLGVFCSLQDDQGMAAAHILTMALKFGIPTQVYADQVDASQPEYNDLTAEWYNEEAIDKGIPQKRMEIYPDKFSRDKITVETIEEWAEHWLLLE